jgi:hypothetical protein
LPRSTAIRNALARELTGFPGDVPELTPAFANFAATREFAPQSYAVTPASRNFSSVPSRAWTPVMSMKGTRT